MGGHLHLRIEITHKHRLTWAVNFTWEPAGEIGENFFY
jgi:hypothetical protein